MLTGKDVLITGATSGIGKATALALAAHEPNLHLVARRDAALTEVAKQARTWGAEVETYPLDLLDDAAVTAFCAAFAAPLDVLIHSAGTVTLGDVAEAGVEALDAQYRLNLRAPYLLTQLFLPKLRKRQGTVVFINSGAGLSAKAGWSQYAATKHALKAVADSLRAEVAGSGMRVLSVYPGRTATPMQEKVRRQEGKPYNPAEFIQAKDVAAIVDAALALPAAVEVSDVKVRPVEK